jgi:hypothetical protein
MPIVIRSILVAILIMFKCSKTLTEELQSSYFVLRLKYYYVDEMNDGQEV